MQPKPMAETSGPFFPSLRFSICVSLKYPLPELVNRQHQGQQAIKWERA
jgi:hypothetical protein